MADIRINISKDVENLVRKLSGHDDSDGLFDTLAEALAFAAAYGFQKGFKKDIEDSAQDPISQQVFRNKGLDPLINLIAVVEEADPLVLESTNEKEQERISIFEKYAYGGLLLLKDELEGSPNDVETVLRLIIDEYNQQNTEGTGLSIEEQIKNI